MENNQKWTLDECDVWIHVTLPCQAAYWTLAHINCCDEPHLRGMNRRARCICPEFGWFVWLSDSYLSVWVLILWNKSTLLRSRSEVRMCHRCLTLLKMMFVLLMTKQQADTRFHVWLSVKLVVEGDQDEAGVTACLDPRIQLSFTVLCGRHWPLPNHAVICLACKHVTIFPEVYNLAKTGWARRRVGLKIPW